MRDPGARIRRRLGGGVQVVLLTAALDGAPPERGADGLAERLADHDWAQPFHLACYPKPSRALDLLRGGGIPWPLRQVCTGGYYLATGGMFTDWREGSRPFWPVLAKTFRPDTVWGVFGNTDAWVIARAIARIANCPWVADVKGHWSTFIPTPLRALLARRFSTLPISRHFPQPCGKMTPVSQDGCLQGFRTTF